jgi:hypothetical protein
MKRDASEPTCSRRYSIDIVRYHTDSNYETAQYINNSSYSLYKVIQSPSAIINKDAGVIIKSRKVKLLQIHHCSQATIYFTLMSLF